MAIKIQNTTVIDDDKNLANVTTATFTGTGSVRVPVGNTAARPSVSDNGMIRYNNEEDTFEGYAGNIWGPIGGSEVELMLIPVNVQPANNAVNVGERPTLQSSGYNNLYNKAKANTQYQISILEDFANTVVDVTVAGTGLTHTIGTDLLNGLQEYYWRHRHQDVSSCFSAFSQTTCFTTPTLFGPTALGQSFDGGFYSGVINIGGGVCYYLLVAPNSTGCAQCAWKTTQTLSPGADSCVNGRTNTYGPLSNATHPAGNFTATRTINGFSDWYLPAKDELNLMFTNRGSMPAGEGYTTNAYWSSTDGSAASAGFMCFAYGTSSNINKSTSNKVRALRRVSV